MRKQLAAAAVVLAACSDSFGPESLGAIPFDPPPSYREMWAQAEACTGRHGDFDRLSWWVVPEVRVFEYDPTLPRTDGIYQSSGAITLAGAVLAHPMVVKHEMIHALGFGPDHPAIPFVDPCHATWRSWDTTEAMLEIPPDLAAYAP